MIFGRYAGTFLPWLIYDLLVDHRDYIWSWLVQTSVLSPRGLSSREKSEWLKGYFSPIIGNHTAQTFLTDLLGCLFHCISYKVIFPPLRVTGLNMYFSTDLVFFLYIYESETLSLKILISPFITVSGNIILSRMSERIFVFCFPYIELFQIFDLLGNETQLDYCSAYVI